MQLLHLSSQDLVMPVHPASLSSSKATADQTQCCHCAAVGSCLAMPHSTQGLLTPVYLPNSQRTLGQPVIHIPPAPWARSCCFLTAASTSSCSSQATQEQPAIHNADAAHTFGAGSHSFHTAAKAFMQPMCSCPVPPGAMGQPAYNAIQQCTCRARSRSLLTAANTCSCCCVTP